MQPININELRYSIITEQDLITLKGLKNILVKSQLYHEAAVLRDLEKRMMEIIEIGKVHGYPTNRELERWRKELSDGEKFYSQADVNDLIELTSKPLKDALAKYEESVRVLINKNISGLISQIHEKDAKMQEDMLEFSEFILNNFIPYYYLSGGESKLNYRRQKQSDTFDGFNYRKEYYGEVSTVYTNQEVYNEFLQYRIDKEKKNSDAKKIEPFDGYWVD